MLGRLVFNTRFNKRFKLNLKKQNNRKKLLSDLNPHTIIFKPLAHRYVRRRRAGGVKYRQIGWKW